MLTAAIVYPVAVIVAIIVAWVSIVRRRPAWQVAARVLLVLYLGWIVGATFFPISLESRSVLDEVTSRLNRPNVIPLRGILDTWAIPGVWPRVRLLGGNVLVFVPFGLLLPTVWPALRRLWRTALAGLLLSASIELGQFGVSLVLGYWYRMADVDDVLLNVTGVLLGYAIFAWLRAGRAARPPGDEAAPGM